MDLKVGTAEKENFEEKTLVTLVLDNSGSMSGEPIEQLNKALEEFKADIQNDSRMRAGLEIAIVKFGSKAETIQEPALISSISMPKLDAKGGLTALNEATKKAIEITQDRKSYYKEANISYKRPWIILLTDGAPTDGDVSALSKEIEKDTKNGKYVFLPIGVDGADMNTLNTMAGYTKIDRNFVKMSPLPMESSKFSEFFEWLSASISLLHNSKEGESVNLPQITWTKGYIAG